MVWTRSGAHVFLDAPPWNGKLELDQIEKGLSILTKIRSGTLDSSVSRFFQVDRNRHQQLEIGDCYVRSNDLIAVFPQTKDRDFSYQFDFKWRSQDGDPVICLESWISVQTNLLDSYPMLTLDFDMAAKEYWSVDAQGMLQSRPCVDSPVTPSIVAGKSGSTEGELNVAVLIHPIDLADSSIDVSNVQCPRVRIRMLGGFMEKGVIRRARLRFIASTFALSPDRIKNEFNEFSNSPLPLTA